MGMSPSGGSFHAGGSLCGIVANVLFRVGRSGKEIEELLRTKGVLIAADYPFFEKHIRVSLGAAEDMQAFWRAWDALMPHHPM